MQQPPQQTRKPSLKALAEGVLSKSERNSSRNKGAMDLLHSPVSEMGQMQHVQQDPDRLPDARAETRRQCVIHLAWSNPEKTYAIHSDDDTTDPVMLAVAIRQGPDSVVSCELAIPKATYDGFSIMELASMRKRPELAVIEGSKPESNQPEPSKSLDTETVAA